MLGHRGFWLSVWPRLFGVLTFVCVLVDADRSYAQTSNAGADAAEPSAEVAEDVDAQAARLAFERGMGAYASQRYDVALDAFRSADTRVPSPNTRLMIGRCLRELGRMAGAIEAFGASESLATERIERGESRYAPTRAAARAERSAVERQSGRIEVDGAGSDVRAFVSGRFVNLSKSRPRVVNWVAPGDHVVERHRPGGVIERHTVHVEAGETALVRFTKIDDAGAKRAGPPNRNGPAGPAPDRKRARRWAWPLAMGAGALTLGATGSFIAFGLDSENRYQRVRDACASGQCGAAQRADADVGARHQTIANISLAVAGVSLVATSVLVWLALDDSYDTPKKGAKSSFMVTPGGLHMTF